MSIDLSNINHDKVFVDPLVAQLAIRNADFCTVLLESTTKGRTLINKIIGMGEEATTLLQILSEATAQGLNNQADWLASQNHHSAAELIYRRALSITESGTGCDLQTADAMKRLADSLCKYRTPDKEAESLYQSALKSAENYCGANDTETIPYITALAFCYRSQYRSKEAIALFARALTIAEKVWGPGHLNTAAPLLNLADLLRDKGKHDEAEPLFQRVLAIKVSTHGTEHLETAKAINHLALFYHDKKNYPAAEIMFRRALAISEKILGAEHPDTTVYLSNLAEALSMLGQDAEAELLFRRALLINEKHLGVNHQDTIDIRYSLECLLKRQDY